VNIKESTDKGTKLHIHIIFSLLKGKDLYFKIHHSMLVNNTVGIVLLLGEKTMENQ
jgi:hypothetical protein